VAGLLNEQSGGLVSYWKTVSAITSRVGSGASARIKRDAARQKWTAPFIVYTRNGGDVYRHLTGTAGVRTTIVHVYCWGDSADDADELSEAVKIAMQSGFARTTWGDTFINRCVIDDVPLDGYDAPIDGSDDKKHWSRVVLRITHTEGGGT
jgi:hypothetical protein